jgi:hypothetical protein
MLLSRDLSDLPMCLPGKESHQSHYGGVLNKDLQPPLEHTPEMYVFILKIILENYNMEMELKFPRMG